MPIDPRELVGVKPGFVEVITSDRQCGKCGYNLKGLPTTGRCPECGRPVSRRTTGGKRFTDNLTEAPLFYLKALAGGTWLLAGGVSTIVLLVLWEWLAVFRLVRVPASWPMVVAATFGLASVAWWTGVYVCTAQRPLEDRTLRDALLESVPLRWVNRATQAAWVAAAGAFFAGLRLPSPQDGYAQWACLVFAIVAVLGVIPLAIQLSSLAEWAGDSELAGRFRASASILAICGGVGVLSWIAIKADLEGFWYAVRILGIWARLGMGVAELVLIVSLYQLAQLASWAISNSLTAQDVTGRLAARAGDAFAHRECAACGYDLSGLDAFSRCPECGHLDEAARQSGLVGVAIARSRPPIPGDDSEIPLAAGDGIAKAKSVGPPPIGAGRRWGEHGQAGPKKPGGRGKSGNSGADHTIV